MIVIMFWGFFRGAEDYYSYNKEGNVNHYVTHMHDSMAIGFINQNSIRKTCNDRLEMCNHHFEKNNLNFCMIPSLSVANLLFSLANSI